jgi:hypothetical protein
MKLCDILLFDTTKIPAGRSELATEGISGGRLHGKWWVVGGGWWVVGGGCGDWWVVGWWVVGGWWMVGDGG